MYHNYCEQFYSLPCFSLLGKVVSGDMFSVVVIIVVEIVGLMIQNCFSSDVTMQSIL